MQFHPEIDGAGEAGLDRSPDRNRLCLGGLAIELGIETDEIDILTEQQFVDAQRIVEQGEGEAETVLRIKELLVNVVKDLTDLVLESRGEPKARDIVLDPILDA